MNRREMVCHSLPLFHLMTIPLRSHPHPHFPACPLMSAGSATCSAHAARPCHYTVHARHAATTSVPVCTTPGLPVHA
jgi:hypothetical protein